MPTQTSNIEDICSLLHDGAAADIWYDAVEHDGEESPSALRIEATQVAMQEAAAYLPKLLDVAMRLKDALVPLSPDNEVTNILLAQAEAIIDNLIQPVMKTEFDAPVVSAT